MMNEKGKFPVFLTLIGIPLSLVTSLIIIYVAMFGSQVPFEIRLKTITPEGKLLNEKGIEEYKMVLIDSVLMLREEVTNLSENTSDLHQQANRFLDSLQVLNIKKVISKLKLRPFKNSWMP